eukprot:448198_1
MTNQTTIISGYTGAEFPNFGKAFAQTQNGMYMAGSSTGDGVYYFDFSNQENPALIASFSGTPIDNYQAYNGPSAICVNNDDPNNILLYVIGGTPATTHAQQYHVTNAVWTMLPSTNQNRRGSSCEYVSENIYLFGEIDEVNKNIERYNVNQDSSWNLLPEQTTGRIFSVYHEKNKQIILFRWFYADILIFDINTEILTLYATSVTNTNGAPSTAIYDRDTFKIYMIGGKTVFTASLGTNGAYMMATYQIFDIPKITTSPTAYPTSFPSVPPIVYPTSSPTILTIEPTRNPTRSPTSKPTVEPTLEPTIPTMIPTINPTLEPSLQPSSPTIEPTTNPTTVPTIEPTINPTNVPNVEPTIEPTARPTIPTIEPTINPTSEPTPLCLVLKVIIIDKNNKLNSDDFNGLYTLSNTETNFNRPIWETSNGAKRI